MLHLLARLPCSCDSSSSPEFWPSPNVARQWNAHSLSPCLYIVMGWPCAARTSEEVWHCAVMCCLLQCSLSMSKHLLFLIWNSLSSACQQQLRIMHTSVHWYTRTLRGREKWQKPSQCNRPWWAKHKWTLPGGQFTFFFSVYLNLKESLFHFLSS